MSVPRYMKRFVLSASATVVLTAALLSCSGADRTSGSAPVVVDTLAGGVVRTMSSAPIDSGHWFLEPLIVIQPPAGAPGELMAPNDIALAADNRVLVAESNPPEVRVFGANGDYLRTIGRVGSGPGEFRAAWITSRGDTLLVQDPQQARASTFLLSDGSFLSAFPTTGFYWAPIGVDRAGRAVMRMVVATADTACGPEQPFVRLTFDGTATDTVYVSHRRGDAQADVWPVHDGDRTVMTVRVPMRPRDEQQVSPSGAFVTVWTSEYLLRVSRDGQDTVALYGRQFTPSPVQMSEKRAIVASRVAEMSASPLGPPASAFEQAFDVDKIPDLRPPFEQFGLDAAGRTWGRRSDPDTTAVRFDLFDVDHRWLDVVEVPAAMWPLASWASVAWGKDRVAVHVEDENGLPAVHVFRIVRR